MVSIFAEGKLNAESVVAVIRSPYKSLLANEYLQIPFSTKPTSLDEKLGPTSGTVLTVLHVCPALAVKVTEVIPWSVEVPTIK